MRAITLDNLQTIEFKQFVRLKGLIIGTGNKRPRLYFDEGGSYVDALGQVFTQNRFTMYQEYEGYDGTGITTFQTGTTVYVPFELDFKVCRNNGESCILLIEDNVVI
jgi:hypothetical protein